MRYLLLLVSLLAIVACSSAQESNTAEQEPVRVAEATSAPVPTWTPTPLPTPTATNTPEPTLVPVTLAEVEMAIALPFKDVQSEVGRVRLALYESPWNGTVMIVLDPDLLRFSNMWSGLALGDQAAAQKFKETFRTLSVLILDTNTAEEAIAFFDACDRDSVGPAVAQSTDTSFFNCESMLIDGTSFRITSLRMEYDYKSKTLMTAVVITQ